MSRKQQALHHMLICFMRVFFQLGVCLGMQLAVIEFARNCLNLKGKSAIF